MNIFDITLFMSGFNLKRAQRELSVIYNIDHSRKFEHRLKRRDEIVNYHIQNNPFYRNLVGAISHDGCFEKLPIITKRDFQKPLKKLLSDGFDKKYIYTGNTSGSSGHPLYYAKDRDSHALTHAIILALYNQYDISPNDKQARFYGIPYDGLSKYKEKLKDFLSNRVRFHVFDLSDKQFEFYLRRFSNTKFGYIYGYTSVIVQFARFMINREVVLFDICPTLKGCIVTSEVCTAEDRELIKKGLGINVINEYGCSEVGLIAFESPDGRWRMVEEDNYYEVVDINGKPLPWGDEGRILITSLSNRAMPIIRYEIGDMGIIDKIEGCLYLRKLAGRVSDVIRLPSGGISAGLTFYYISRALLEKLGIIKEFIVRQTAIDTFVFEVVSDRNFTVKEQSILKQQMDNYLEPGLKLIINRVERIKRPNSGKIKHFYSEI